MRGRVLEEAARATIDDREEVDIRAWLLERYPGFEDVVEDEEAFN